MPPSVPTSPSGEAQQELLAESALDLVLALALALVLVLVLVLVVVEVHTCILARSGVALGPVATAAAAARLAVAVAAVVLQAVVARACPPQQTPWRGERERAAQGE